MIPFLGTYTIAESRDDWNISVSCHPLVEVGSSCRRLLDFWESGVVPIPKRHSKLPRSSFLTYLPSLKVVICPRKKAQREGKNSQSFICGLALYEVEMI